jgi:hypothetical protein
LLLNLLCFFWVGAVGSTIWEGSARHKVYLMFNPSLLACSVSSQSMWIEWDWVGLNPK